MVAPDPNRTIQPLTAAVEPPVAPGVMPENPVTVAPEIAFPEVKPTPDPAPQTPDPGVTAQPEVRPPVQPVTPPVTPAYSKLPGYTPPENLPPTDQAWIMPERPAPVAAATAQAGEEGVSTEEAMAANWRQSTLYALMQLGGSRGEKERQPDGYDALQDDDWLKDPRLAPYADKALGLDNSLDAAELKQSLLRDQQDKETLAHQSTAQWIMGAGLQVASDPTLWASLAVPPLLGARAGAAIGYSAGRAAIAQGAIEVSLQAGAQIAREKAFPTQTKGDSLRNMLVAGAIVGGVAGVQAGMMTREYTKALTTHVANDIAGVVPDANSAAGSVVQLTQQAVTKGEAPWQVMKGLAEGSVRIPGYTGAMSKRIGQSLIGNPILRTLTASSEEAAKVGSQLAESGMDLAMFREGIAAPKNVESERRVWLGKYAQRLNEHDNIYAQYRRENVAMLTRVDQLANYVNPKLVAPKKQFNEDVYRAMSDWDNLPPTPVNAYDKAVRDSARSWREFNDWAWTEISRVEKQAVEGGLMPESRLTQRQKDYTMRAFDHSAIITRRSDFMRLMKDWISKNSPNKVQLAAEDIEKAAELAYEKIARHGVTTPDELVKEEWLNAMSKAGPLRKRTLNMPNNFSTVTDDGRTVALWDFLEKDIQVVADRYQRKVGAEVALTDVFGDPTMKNVIQKVSDEYAEMAAKITDPKKLMELDAERKRVIDAIVGMRDKHRGVFGISENMGSFAQVIRTGNRLAPSLFLGVTALAQGADTVRLMAQSGLGGFMTDFLPGALRGFTNVLKSGRNVESDMASMALGVNRALNTRLSAFSDSLENVGYLSRAEHMAADFTRNFMKITGVNHITDVNQIIGATMVGNRIVRAAVKGKTTEPYMARLGLNASDLDKIKALVADGTIEKVRGAYGFNLDNWADQTLANKVRAGISAEVHNLVIQPGVGTSFLMKSPATQALFAFQSFTMASLTKILGSNLQKGAKLFLAEMIMTSAYHGLEIYLRTYLNHGSEKANAYFDSPENAARLAGEAIARNGALSVAGEAFNMGNRFLGSSVPRAADVAEMGVRGVTDIAGVTTPGTPNSMQTGNNRYINTQVGIGSVAPIVSYADDVRKAIIYLNGAYGPWVSEDEKKPLTQSKARTIVKAVPGSSLIWLKALDTVGAGPRSFIEQFPEE